MLVVSLIALAAPSTAAQASSSAAATHRSVGSRLDSPLAPAKSKAITRVPYRVPDQAAFARAKRAAAGRTSGPGSFARSDFTISALPLASSIVQGTSTTFTVHTSATSGSPRPVSFSVSGLPAGATGTFSPVSVQAGGSSTLTVATTTTAQTGTFTLTISGNYSSPPTTHTTTVSLTVTPRAVDDFSIAAAPSSNGILQGESTAYSVSTEVTSGSAQTVTFSLAGLPAGASGTFSPAAILAGGGSTLTVTTSTSTPTGTFTLTISGAYASPPKTHSTTVTLTINAPVPNDDFSINALPASQSVVQGQSISYTVTTQVTSGNARTVMLSVSGLAAGATGTFNPPSVTAGGTSTLTVTTTTTAATGTVTLVITGTSSSATRSTSVMFTVTSPPPDEFSLSAVPTLRTVAQGASTTYQVDTQVTSGNAQSVSLTVSGLPIGASGTFNPPSVTAGASSVLTVATTTAAAIGTYNLTLIGHGSAGPTHAATVSLEVAAPSSGPTVGVSWNGQYESDLAPPDPTGAIGPNSYIELINVRYGIYGRDGTLINEGDLGQLTRFPVGELSDPQIVWDPTSQRFYYLAVDFVTSQFAFGYSKTADPRSDDEFCHYQVGAFYGAFTLPDYPKLAVTRDFVLIGSNVFFFFSIYMGSDVNWFEKPTNPVCPPTLGQGGTFSALKNADGSLMSTPEPAVALDANSDGWIVGSNDVSTTGGADYLTAFKVTKNTQSGQAQISAPMTVTVPRYEMPANAPQSGTTQLLDTMDTRLTHAVAGYDPRLDATAIWTAHTVFGGAGAEVRWFEISTASAPVLSQTGTVTDADLYVFNGAISSDRAADDATTPAAATGRNMVMGFNTSSSATFAAIKMVSRRGTSPQSGVVLVKQSPGPYVDSACGSSVPDVCRWGDYAGATPDPLSANGGQVWLSNEWNEAMTDGSTPTWRTWNWSARP